MNGVTPKSMPCQRSQLSIGSACITIKDVFSYEHSPIEKITGLKDHRVAICPHEQKMFDIPFRVLVGPGEREGSNYTSGFDVVIKSGGHSRQM